MRYNSCPKRCLVSNMVILMVVILASLVIPLRIRADIGAKPSMEFQFVLETDAPLTIVEVTLLQCNDAACSDAQPLPEAGPQRITCTQDQCSSMAYGYTDYNRLVIRFSDGVTRQSNVFGKKHFDADYRVTVRENDMLVEETGGRTNPMVLILLGSFVGVGIAGLLIIAMLVVLVRLIVKEGQGNASFEESRGLFIAAWIIVVPLVGLGSLFSLALPLTILIEAVVALVYASLRKRSRLTLLTLVTLANLLTQPALWFVLGYESGVSYGVIGIVEFFIWLVEAVILYLTQRKTLSFKEALGLSLALNVASFLIGLVLRV